MNALLRAGRPDRPLQEAAPARRIALPCGGAAPLIVEVRPQARRILLTVDPARRAVVAAAPSRRRAGEAERFAQDHAAWIAPRWAALPPAAPFTPGGRILLHGAPARLIRAAVGAPAGCTRADGEAIFAVRDGRRGFEAATRTALKALARRTLQAHVDRHAATLGLDPGPPIRLADGRSRWGSCARGGRLSFSWRLIAASPTVLDYVAAHETAHRREHNHSPRFWALVEALHPDRRAAEAWLKANGPVLHAQGAQA